jgi:molybdopterin molybdotransferase
MSTANAPGVLTFEDARHVVEQHAAQVNPQTTEEAPLLKAIGRVLAETLLADRDFPPFRRATRDGYAVHATDLASVPVELEVVAEIKAGVSPDAVLSELRAGQVAFIMTGAPVPDRADAVVMVEYTSREGNRVQVKRTVSAGENVVPTGAEAKRGNVLVEKGVRLTPATIALAASVGKAVLLVHKRPRVAILSTGDEIVEVTAQPGPYEIRNSNSYSLAAQVEASGGEAVLLPVAPDEATRLRELIEQGLSADLLLLTGGVSMGKYDLVEQVMAELEAEFLFTGAQIQPGRPIVFGRVPAHKGRRSSENRRASYFFGLPGNPVSTMVTFELFARPMIEALAGMAARPLIFTHARLRSEIKTKTGLKRFLPSLLTGEFERAEVELVPWQGSGDVAATARANCYIVIPPDRERIATGEWVAVLRRY